MDGTVLVVGAGLAGSRCAETLRAEGFEGRESSERVSGATRRGSPAASRGQKRQTPGPKSG